MTIWQPFQLFRHTNDAHLSNCFILETNACIFIITSRARLWWYHGLRTPGEEIAFTAQPKINSHSQSFRYGRSIFCLSATSAQIFRFLWFMPSLGVRSPWVIRLLRFTVLQNQLTFLCNLWWNKYQHFLLHNVSLFLSCDKLVKKCVICRSLSKFRTIVQWNENKFN